SLKTRCVAIGLLAVAIAAGRLNTLQAADAAQESASKIIHREDVVYGQVHGAGLLADIAYPDTKEPLPAIISVHGGRWVGGHKRDTSTIKVQQWAGFGF